MSGRSTGRRRAAAVLPVVVVLAVAAPVAATPAVARSCPALAAAATSTGGRTQVLLTLPAGLAGRRLRPTDVSFVQEGLDLPVLSVAPVPATATDVVLVVDTSAASAGAVEGVRAAATALLRRLPAGTSVAVLATGGTPTVVSDLARGPLDALPALADLSPAGPDVLVDSVLAGIRQLPTDPRRQQQLVVVAAGGDEGSSASWAAAQQLLVRRGVALDVVDLGATPSLPGAGAQCPGVVAAAAAPAAATALADRIDDRRLVLLPAVTGAGPVQVTVTTGGTSVSTVLTTRDVVAPAEPAARDDSGGDAIGAGTLALAFVVGLLGLVLLMLVIGLRSARGSAARVALRDLRASRLPGLPEAEALRRRSDARTDLAAALGGGLTAARHAELAAYDEAMVRAAEAEQRRAAEERAAAYARAADRRVRTQRQAEEAAALDRAAREATARLDRLRPLPRTGLSGADPAALSVLAEAEHAVAAQRHAAQEAMTRRAEAEKAADEAEARAERERVAAAEAQRSREAAEQAAAEASARAEEELRTAGVASQARQQAEEQARVAAGEAAEERRAAEEAVARRLVAEAQAAEAEAAQDAAVHRELAALEAAEAAEETHREAVARLQQDRVAADDEAALTVDLRSATTSLVSPATETAARRPQVVVPVEGHRIGRTGGTGGAGRSGSAGGPGFGSTDGPGPVPDDEGRGDADELPVVAEEAPAAADETPVVADETPVVTDEAPSVEDAVPTVADGPLVDDEPTAGAAVVAAPAGAWTGTATDDVPAAGPDVAGVELLPRSRAVPLAALARVLALAVVPAALLLRGLVGGGWSQLGTSAVVLLAVAAVLTVLGVRWAWVATTPPYALRRRTARRIVASEELQRTHTDDAARLLASVRAGTVDGAWDAFEERTGLVVPGATRSVVDADMDPAAFVRYLTARQRDGLVAPQPLVVVALVPLLVCLLPAALLVLAS